MRIFLVLVAAFCSVTSSAWSQEIGSFERPVVPTQTIELWNGKDFNGWYTWLTKGGHDDPRGVFTVQPNGLLRISGDGFGGLITRQSYSQYHLVMEYRWGTVTWEPRKDRARDGGLLLHAYGPDGGFGGTKDQPGPWMTSIECQIIEGGVGDILVLQGLDEKGNRLEAACTCEVQKDRDGENCWKAAVNRSVSPKAGSTGTVAIPTGRTLWASAERGTSTARSGMDQAGVLLYRDSLIYVVNGTVVNRASAVTPNRGKILLQTEGAEMFVRRLELRPLPAKLP